MRTRPGLLVASDEAPDGSDGPVAKPTRALPELPVLASGSPVCEAPIRLVIAQDQAVVLQGLQSFLTLEPDVTVVAACTTGETTLEAVRRHRPDILLLDLVRPGLDDLGVLRVLKHAADPPRVILLTASIGDEELLEALRLGVSGVFLKGMPPHLLLQCIHRVHAGEHWIEKQAAARALNRLLQREASTSEVSRLLTRREMEIARMVAQGLRTNTIADRLNVAQATVKNHLHNIYDKLKLDGRVALTIFARDKGLV